LISNSQGYRRGFNFFRVIFLHWLIKVDWVHIRYCRGISRNFCVSKKFEKPYQTEENSQLTPETHPWLQPKEDCMKKPYPKNLVTSCNYLKKSFFSTRQGCIQGGVWGVNRWPPLFLGNFFQLARVFWEKNPKTHFKFSWPYKKVAIPPLSKNFWIRSWSQGLIYVPDDKVKNNWRTKIQVTKSTNVESINGHVSEGKWAVGKCQ